MNTARYPRSSHEALIRNCATKRTIRSGSSRRRMDFTDSPHYSSSGSIWKNLKPMRRLVVQRTNEKGRSIVIGNNPQSSRFNPQGDEGRDANTPSRPLSRPLPLAGVILRCLSPHVLLVRMESNWDYRDYRAHVSLPPYGGDDDDVDVTRN